MTSLDQFNKHEFAREPNGTSFSETPSPSDIASDWLIGFSEILSSGHVSNVALAFLPDGWLRDSLVFSWDARSLRGATAIASYLSEVLPRAQFTAMALDKTPELGPTLVPYSPDVSGIEFAFTFETPVILGRGYVRLLPDPAEEIWKALSVFMEVRDIKGHEEADHELGLYEGHTLSWGEVANERRAQIESEPEVIISEFHNLRIDGFERRMY
jgi:hypothetical protein